MYISVGTIVAFLILWGFWEALFAPGGAFYRDDASTALRYLTPQKQHQQQESQPRLARLEAPKAALPKSSRAKRILIWAVCVAVLMGVVQVFF